VEKKGGLTGGYEKGGPLIKDHRNGGEEKGGGRSKGIGKKKKEKGGR